MVFSGFLILAFYYSNVWNTSYLPINSNGVFDHFGSRYNISKAVDAHGMFNPKTYEAYSQAHMAAGNM